MRTREKSHSVSRREFIKLAGDSILMSVDPVAHDTVGLQLAAQVLDAEGSSTESTTSQATAWLENGVQLGLGTSDVDQIEWVEMTLWTTGRRQTLG